MYGNDDGAAASGKGSGSEKINDQAMTSITLSIPEALLAIATQFAAPTPFLTAGPVYAAAGLFIFPLGPEKEPLIRWGEGATNDPHSPLFRRFATAGVGIACKPSGLLVVDLDIKHPPVDGCRSWAELTRASGDPDVERACFDRTALVSTTSGGLHLWFANPEGIPGRDNLLPGIDVKAAQGNCGGFAVAPPTPGYSVLAVKPPLVVPGWLALILTHKARPKREERSRGSAQPVDSGGRERLAAALKARKGAR